VTLILVVVTMIVMLVMVVVKRVERSQSCNRPHTCIIQLQSTAHVYYTVAIDRTRVLYSCNRPHTCIIQFSIHLLLPQFRGSLREVLRNNVTP
jgi:hypothetical protein